MSTEPVERRTGSIPRQIERECHDCGGMTMAYNGAYFRNLREQAKLTLAEMARAIGGVTGSHLSRMELGYERFLEQYARAYERLFERRRKAGEYLDDEDEAD
jgi:transcriptional regulator with XRE-family HTH domain